MNKILTKEQIEVLKQFENEFHCVLELKYKRNNTRSEIDIVCDIYEKCTGEILKREFQCPSCQFNIFAKVGTLYRKSVAYWNEQETIQEAEMQETTKNEVKVLENTEVKPKRTYKKKNI